ncbi:MAG TPA: OB-fold domain-containing protein [Candidatus Binataceae bacterium]|nr:OB-fold domain-containing protein [Candidatus Binataceae bacterium]
MKTENPAPADKRSVLLRGNAKEFYEWCRKRELRFQRCQDCGVWRHPPRPMCGSCHSMRREWAPTLGKGKVYCWTVVHQALDPAFANEVPYAAAIVELDEGPRLATWITGLPPDRLTVGMPVEVWFDDLDDQVALPKFRPLIE